MSQTIAATYQAQQEEKFWLAEGPRTAAFLLVIPGAVVTGAGIGMLVDQIVPYSVIGLGLGMVLWGLVVVLRKRPKMP